METASEKPPTKQPARAPAPEMDSSSLLLGGLVVLLLGGLIGWWLGTGTARDAVAKAKLELVQQRAAGAQEMVRGLNAELLLILRRSLGGEAARLPLTQVIDDLKLALEAIEKDPADKDALARFREAQRRLADVRVIK